MPKPSPAEGFAVMLQDTARVMRVKLDQRLRPLGLSQAKWRTIVNVAQAGEGITQKELADRLGVEGPTLVRTLDRLQADGWLERRGCPDDRRSKRVFLLERSHETLRHIASVAEQLRTEALEGVSEDDIRRCREVLERVKSRVESLP